MSGRTTREFDLPGLLPAQYYCVGCAKRLCEEIRTLEGVTGSSCDEDAGTLQVSYDASRVSGEDLEREVVRIGLQVVGAVEHAAYRLTGLD